MRRHTIVALVMEFRRVLFRSAAERRSEAARAADRRLFARGAQHDERAPHPRHPAGRRGRAGGAGRGSGARLGRDTPMEELPMRAILTALALSFALPMAACSRDASEAESAATIPLTTVMAGQAPRFDVAASRTHAEPRRGLVVRSPAPHNGERGVPALA